MQGAPPYPAGPGRFGPVGPRRHPVRWIFIGIAVAIIGAGVVFLALSLDPSAFGLSYRSFFPFGGGFLGLFLIFWGALLLVRIALRTSGRRYGGGPGRGMRFDPAIAEARRRYARGEITREQFEQLVTDLRRPPGPLP